MRLTPADRAEFDDRLEEVLEELPEDIQELLQSVPLIVEDEPSLEIQRDFGIRPSQKGSDLCGLHWGVPLGERSILDPAGYPDQVFLFRGPILRLAGRNSKELSRQILITLLHELGHHFGMSEERLRELGYD